MRRFAAVFAVALFAALGCGAGEPRCPDEGLELRLSVDGDVERARTLITRRLEAGGYRCAVVTATGDGVTVRLAEPLSERFALVRLLTTPAELMLAANADRATYDRFAEALSAATPAGPRHRFDTSHLIVDALERGEAQAFVRAVAPPAGHRIAYDAAPGGTAVWLLKEAGALMNPEVTDVQTSDDFGPAVTLTLGAADGARFAALTRAHLQTPLPMALDDTLLMAPVVMDAIDGGRLTISLGGGEGPDDAMRLRGLLAGAGLPPTRLVSQGVWGP